jgi:apolipoprotein N-acyltransferase
MTKLSRLAALVILVAIICVTLGPVGLRPQAGHPNLERAAAFFLLGSLTMLAFPNRLVQVLVGVTGLAITLEMLQLIDPGRDGRLIDALIKIAAGLSGIVLVKLLLWWRGAVSH